MKIASNQIKKSLLFLILKRRRTLDLNDIEFWSHGVKSFDDAGFGRNAAIIHRETKVKVTLDFAGGKNGQHSGVLVGAILIAVNLASRSKGAFASFHFVILPSMKNVISPSVTKKYSSSVP